MSTVIIYHNPRCSKSRQTLALLQAQGIEPEIVEYLKTPLSPELLQSLAEKLGLRPAEFVRHKESQYAAEGLSAESSDADLIAAMVRSPILIERPIVVQGQRAVLGRPPENIAQLF